MKGEKASTTIIASSGQKREDPVANVGRKGLTERGKEAGLCSPLPSVFRGGTLPVGDYFMLPSPFNLKFNRLMIYTCIQDHESGI